MDPPLAPNRCERGWICSYLIGGEDFIFGKKVISFFRARAVAPVATTALGLRGCTCARPKEVVVWYGESRGLRSTLEYFSISFGSGISFCVKMPVISSHDPEIYEHRATMVLENEIW